MKILPYKSKSARLLRGLRFAILGALTSLSVNAIWLVCMLARPNKNADDILNLIIPIGITGAIVGWIGGYRLARRRNIVYVAVISFTFGLFLVVIVNYLLPATFPLRPLFILGTSAILGLLVLQNDQQQDK